MSELIVVLFFSFSSFFFVSFVEPQQAYSFFFGMAWGEVRSWLWESHEVSEALA